MKVKTNDMFFFFFFKSKLNDGFGEPHNENCSFPAINDILLEKNLL